MGRDGTVRKRERAEIPDVALHPALWLSDTWEYDFQTYSNTLEVCNTPIFIVKESRQMTTIRRQGCLCFKLCQKFDKFHNSDLNCDMNCVISTPVWKINKDCFQTDFLNTTIGQPKHSIFKRITI